MNDIEKRIKELEEERDHLLATTSKIVTTTTKTGKQYTNHTSIKSKYNAKITSLKKYGVENPMALKEVRDKQKNNAKKAWDNEDRRKQCSENWKRILSDPAIKEKRIQSLKDNHVYKEYPKTLTRAEAAKLKAEKAYNRYKEEFGGLLISTFDEYYNKKHHQDILFRCSVCNEPFKTSVYNYRDGLTRCKNCRREYKSEAIKNSLNYQNGIKKRNEAFRQVKIETLKEIWKDELELFEDSITKTGNYYTRIKYKCKKCGHVGWQAISYLSLGLVYGTGCSNSCHKSYKGSSYEQEIYEFLKELGLQEDTDFIRHDRSLIKNENGYPLELDFYLPKYKVAIEFNGTYYHSYNYHVKNGLQSSIAKNYHYNKTRQCEDLGIHLIHIWQHEWISLKDRIKSIIKGELGLTKNKIYARDCEFKEIPQNEYRDFVTRLSVLRYRNAKHKYGLYYKDKLMMVMSIDKCQSGKGSVLSDKLEIVRSVTELDTIVVGGTSKLLKHIKPIINELYPDIHELVYFVDYDKHLGKSAEGTGAIFDGYSGPSSQNYCVKVCDLINDRGEVRHLQFGKIYARIPSHHKAITEAIKRDDVWALYTSGTKKFHYDI